jgi:hypothetical protein
LPGSAKDAARQFSEKHFMDMDKPGVSSTPPRRRKGLRLLAWIAGAFTVLVVAGYFVATSSGFLKSVILPRVSESLNADVTVADAAIRAVPDGDVVARLRQELGHGQPHAACANPTYAWRVSSHARSPFMRTSDLAH